MRLALSLVMVIEFANLGPVFQPELTLSSTDINRSHNVGERPSALIAKRP